MATRKILHIAVITGIAALPLLAAERLAVKTGLWENTITMQISGMTIPADQLAQMSAAERAQTEALLKELGVGAPRTVVEQSCLTDKDLDGNAFISSMKDAGGSCEYQQVTGTTRQQEWTFQCSVEDGGVAGRLQINVQNDARVQGAMQARMAEGTMDMKFEANWKSGDCGDVTPD